MRRTIYTLLFAALTFLGNGQAGSVLKLLNTIELSDVDIPPTTGGGFGSSVVSMGDLNQDGVEDLAVGASPNGVGVEAACRYLLFAL